MKAIFKLMSAALLVGSLASCSDDLGLGNAAYDKALSGADLIGTLASSTETRIGITDNVDPETGRLTAAQQVWTEGDQVRVFTLDAMTYNLYTLDAASANQQRGAFNKTQAFSALTEGQLYAITEDPVEGNKVYSVAPNENGEATLTMTIKPSYSLHEDLLTPDGKKVNKFPAPYWGVAKVNEVKDGEQLNYKLDVYFKALTSFLRIDCNNLPVGTRAIVLTTHGSRTSWMPTGLGIEQEGFQLTDNLDYVRAFDVNGNLKKAWVEWYNSTADFIVGGQSEPLSGTMSAVLEDGASLQPNPEVLVCSDTLRINLDDIPFMQQASSSLGEDTKENGDKVIYVPIIAGDYHNLHVIAVTHDSPLSYQWVGQELQQYTDKTFYLNKIEQLRMKVDIDVSDATSWSELSQIIAEEAMENKGRTLEVNVPEDYTDWTDDAILYIDNSLTNNNVVLNFQAPFVQGNTVGGENQFYPQRGLEKYDILITEGKYTLNKKGEFIGFDVPTDEVASAESQRTITINVSNEPGMEETAIFKVVTPTSDVVLGTNNDLNNTEVQFAVRAGFKHNTAITGNTGEDSVEGVSGHDLITNNGVAIMNRKNANVFVKNGIGVLEILPNSRGDVYIYTGGQEDTEIYHWYAVRSDWNLNTRATDAMVYNVWIGDTDLNDNRYFFTNGYSAVGMVKRLYKSEILDPITEVAPYTTLETEAVVNDDMPLAFHMVSYWTGAALQPAFIERYCKSYVYTVAQLASVGENVKDADGNVTFTVPSQYAIPENVVTEMWLGGNYWPWIGAEVDVEDFFFDGRVVSLQNMMLDIEDKTFEDPHHCCTSCGPVNHINLDRNIGLFRSIINTTSAEVEDIDLNDVFVAFEAPIQIDNIGCITGLVSTPKATFTHNLVGEPKIDVNGMNVGGMIGLLAGQEENVYGTNDYPEVAYGDCDLVMTNNSVTGLNDGKSEGWIKSQLGNVGGQIGMAKTKTATITNSVVDLEDPLSEIYAGKYETEDKDLVSRVGGIIGYQDASGVTNYYSPRVRVQCKSDFWSPQNAVNKIQGLEKEVGGIGGFLDSEAAVNVMSAYYETGTYNVQTPLIESINNGYVGGEFGYLKDKGTRFTGENVYVPTITATGKNKPLNEEGRDVFNNDDLRDKASYAGGLIGYFEDYAEAPNDAFFIENQVDRKSVV